MDPKNLPYYMISQPALTGYVEPALGRGFLTFYADVSDPIGAGTIRFTLTVAAPPQICRSEPLALLGLASGAEAERGQLPQSPGPVTSFWPWHDTGWQPFAWDLLPPVGARQYPVIRLVLARSVQLKVKVLNGVNPGAPKNLGFVLGPRSPFVKIFRPQDDSLIPQPGDPIDPSRFLGEPFLAGPGAEAPGAEKRGLNGFMTVNVTPKPLGVEIRNVFDGYRIDFGIDPRKEGQPAAYAYELITPVEDPELGGVILRIVHTDNIYINARAHENFEDNIRVQSARVRSTDNVPPQGSPLAHFILRPVDIEVKRSPRHRGLIFLFELAIGFVPYVGVLYNISQLVYAMATGRDFWGQEVTDLSFVMMGLAAVLPIALKSKPAVATLRAELKGSALARALDEGVTNELYRVVADRNFLHAVELIDPKTAAQLARMLTLFASGQVRVAQFLQRFNEAIIKAYMGGLARRSLEQLMTADFRTFKNSQLAAGFNAFAVRLGKKGSSRVADPIAWALRQNGRSRYLRELARELGPQWRDTLKAGRNDARFNPLSSTELAHYDSLAGRVEDYTTLAKRNKGHGQLFEADHILEQRFWRNDPRVEIAFNEKGEGLAMLVPKNPAVAAKMPGNTIAYVHTTKSRMLADLMPNGREAEFSVQQIWDAHVFVLEALQVHRSVTFGTRLLSDFRLLAYARGERLIIRPPTGPLFLPDSKWPVLVGSSS